MWIVELLEPDVDSATTVHGHWTALILDCNVLRLLTDYCGSSILVYSGLDSEETSPRRLFYSRPYS